MDKNVKQPVAAPFELENIFILRLPQDVAEDLNTKFENKETVRNIKDILKLDLNVETNKGIVKYNETPLYGKLYNVPCIIECLKTLDRKNYYKSGDISQILVCKKDPYSDSDGDSGLADASKSQAQLRKEREKRLMWNHGITPPLKNVRKRRFRKIIKKKTLDLPQIEREVRRLLQADNEAQKVTWQLIYDEPPPQSSNILSTDGKQITSTLQSQQQTTSHQENELPTDKTSANQISNAEQTTDGDKMGVIAANNEIVSQTRNGTEHILLSGEARKEDIESQFSKIDVSSSQAIGETDLFGEALSSSESSIIASHNDNSSIIDDAESEDEQILSDLEENNAPLPSPQTTIHPHEEKTSTIISSQNDQQKFSDFNNPENRDNIYDTANKENNAVGTLDEKFASGDNSLEYGKTDLINEENDDNTFSNIRESLALLGQTDLDKSARQIELESKLENILDKKRSHLADIEKIENPALRLRFQRLITDLETQETEIRNQLENN